MEPRVTMEPKYEKQFRNAQKMLTSEVSMMAEAYGDTDEFHAKIGELRGILRTVGDYENSFLKMSCFTKPHKMAFLWRFLATIFEKSSFEVNNDF